VNFSNSKLLNWGPLSEISCERILCLEKMDLRVLIKLVDKVLPNHITFGAQDIRKVIRSLVEKGVGTVKRLLQNTHDSYLAIEQLIYQDAHLARPKFYLGEK